MADILTPVLGLTKPAMDSPADVRVLNANFDILDAAALGGAGGSSAGRNLLTNPGFEVWQRGPGPFATGGSFAADRWRLVLGTGSTATVTQETLVRAEVSGLALKCVYAHGTGVSTVEQRPELFPAAAFAVGASVAFALRVRQDGVANLRPWIDLGGVRTYGAPASTTGAWVTLSVVTPYAGTTGLTVGVEMSASGTVYLDNATLVLGPNGTLPIAFAPVHPADDLERCQRYYQEIGGLAVDGEFVASGYVVSTINCQVIVRYVVEMATTPAITIVNPTAFEVGNALGASISCTQLYVSTPSLSTRQACRLIATVAGGLVAGDATWLRATNTTARLQFSAAPPP